MMNPNQTPSILADFTKHRIRITKHTLRCLGNPEYVRLLINPETRSIAIEACDHTEPLRHRIPSYVRNSKQSYEIYSTTLFEQLLHHTNWDTNRAYKMFASAQAGDQLLIFRFDESFQSAGGIPVIADLGKRDMQ